MKREIKHTIFFPHPPETVWDYLTKSELLSQWLMENDIQPVVGHQFQFRSKPNYDIDFDGIVYCEVLRIVPLKQFSYSWKCNPSNGGFKIDTIVEWTLTPKDNGTELNLHQTGFKANEYEGFYMAMSNGWIVQTEKLLQNLNSNLR
jgi:uncharacterized protein YndB with AHSA1/START domain